MGGNEEGYRAALAKPDCTCNARQWLNGDDAFWMDGEVAAICRDAATKAG